MDAATDTGKATISGKITLIQDEGENAQSGIIMYMPVYRNGTLNDTIEQRRANVTGWVYASFRMNDLMRGVFGNRLENYTLDIFDGKNMIADALLYHSGVDFPMQGIDEPILSAVQRFDILDKGFTARVRTTSSLYSKLDIERVYWIMALGVLFSSLLALLFWLLSSGRAKAIQQARELRIAAAAFESQEGIMVTDENSVILRVNNAFTRTTGYTTEEAVGQTPRILKSGRHGENFYAEMWETLKQTGKWQGEVWDKRKDGEIYPKWLNITEIKGADGKVTNYVGVHTDVTDRKAAEREIQHLAFYDPLTKLPNRRLLLDRLKQALPASGRAGRAGALLFIDLDDFKSLNDTLGHAIGDLLLQQVAQRLEHCVREGDTVARLGGDEFVVILEDLGEQLLEAAAQTETIAEKILVALAKSYNLDGHDCRSTPSIGVTLFSGRKVDVDELMKQADIAMYQAKRDGRNRVCFFDPHMQERIAAYVALESELRKAIDGQQFELYYQIQVDGSNLPLGAEALIRWVHPERGIISPQEFIALAEDTGMILPIGQWVLETACYQIQCWQKDPLTRDLVLAINVSAKQFYQADFATRVQLILERYAIQPGLLKLELTEGVMLESIEDTIETMNALNEIGVQISLDDFGTGYSSLQYLKRLPLSQLKIDQSFVGDIAVDQSDRAIVRTIIAMAHSLHLGVIAEGVETEEQRQFLLQEGCTQFQGYLFSMPVPIATFEALLKQG